MNDPRKERRAIFRFLDRVKIDDAEKCWPWRGGHIPQGYGTFWDSRRVVVAHRFAYEMACGPVPAGMELDHLCRNRGCVNPSHLEVVTRKENVLRGLRGRLYQRAELCKTCKQPEPLPNIRLCRTCYNARKRALYRERREGQLYHHAFS